MIFWMNNFSQFINCLYISPSYMVKISVKEGWSNKSKLAILGLIGSMALIIAVMMID